MPLRHVVLLRWTERVGPAEVEAVEQGLGELPGAIPEIVSYAYGRDLGLGEGNYDFAIVAEFRNAEDWAAYRDHPAHLELIEQRIRPILASRVAVQF